MMWLSQSPDHNPIKNLWFHLKRRPVDHEAAPRGVTELWERMETEWQDIDRFVCQDLTSSMHRKVAEVRKAKVSQTEY